METSPQTLEDIAYEKLTELIVSGKLPVNEFLSQRKLAQQVGTAVITVRGALRRLENAGLIENVPKWGVRIPLESEEDLRDRYFMREILEIAAVRRIRQANLPADREKLLQMADACDQLAQESPADIQQFAQLHFSFHHGIAECSGSKSLLDAVGRLNMKSLLFWNAKRVWGERHDRTAYHRSYIETILSDNCQEMEHIVQTHMAQGLKHELASLKKQT